MGTTVEVGQAVRVVDEMRKSHHGLVTAVHGHNSKEERDESYKDYNDKPGSQWTTAQYEAAIAQPWYPPSINVVYVSSDKSKHDPYGQQLERLSSLPHRELAAKTMDVPGRYWDSL